MILVERGPASSHAPAEPARAGEPAPDVLEFPSARRLGWSLKVHYRNDERSRFRRLPGGWLYVASPTGLECFPDLAAIIDNAHFTGLPAALDALEHMRPAAFVAYDEQTEELQFGRSLDGFASLYFGGELPAIVIGESNFVVARRLGPIRFSKADEDWWCNSNDIEGEGSFLDGVKRCFSGLRYQAAIDKSAAERHMVMQERDLLQPGSDIAFLQEDLINICTTYRNKRIALRLSGGVDSRVVLAALVQAVQKGILRHDQILLTSVAFPGFDCDESFEIRAIAQITGFEFIEINATREVVGSAYEESLCNNYPPFPTAFVGLLCMIEAQKRGAQVVISGHGGDEIFGLDLIDVLARSISLRMRLFPLVQTMLRAQSIRANVKAVAITLLGWRALRQVLRDAMDLGGSPFRVHRFGRRCDLAAVLGYEAAAMAAAARGLRTDVPLFRSSFMSRFDPVAWRPSGSVFDKPAARRLIEQASPNLSSIPYRAVTFDKFVHHSFGDGAEICDAVDRSQTQIYSSRCMYRAWQRRVLRSI